MVAHRSLQAEFAGLDRAQDKDAPTIWFGVAAPTFDPSIADMMWTLSRGHTLAVYEKGAAYSEKTEDSAAHQILKSGARRMLCTPSFAALLLADQSGRAALAQIDVLQVGGEPIAHALANDLLAAIAKGGRLLNFYGPTECTIWSSAGPIDPTAEAIDLGAPLDNVTLHVLAPDEAEQAAGVPGELCIAGPHVALGYWNRSTQTQRHFVNDVSGRGRLYRTGDSVCRLDDGRIVYVGRRDFQAKIRGHRIELAEVERAMLQLGALEQAVALVRPVEGAAPPENRLDAYFSLRADQSLTPQSLRAHLQTALPEFAIPDRLIKVDAFALTPNGKIDRRALALAHAPSTRTDAQQSEASCLADPADAITQDLLQVWQNCLGRPDLLPNSDFFAFGGHSLAGARILAAVNARYSTQLGLAAFLSAPSVARMATLIRTRTEEQRGPLIILKAGAPGLTPLTLVHGAGGNVMLFQALAERLDPTQPVWGLEAPGVDGKSTPLEDIGAMAELYIAALLNADPRGPYCLGGFSGGGVVAIEMAHRLVQRGYCAPLVVLFDTLAPWRPTENIPLAEKIRFAPRTSPVTIARWVKANLFKQTEQPTALTPLEQHGAAVIDAMDRALMKWSPPKYGGKIVLFRAQTARLSYVAAGPALGWDETFTDAIEIIPVPATHDTLFTGPAADMIAAQLGPRLTSHLRAANTRR
jgi:thioesterase domain-containing protein